MAESYDIGLIIIIKAIFKLTTLAQPGEFPLILYHTHLPLLQIMEISSHIAKVNMTHVLLPEFCYKKLPCNTF